MSLCEVVIRPPATDGELAAFCQLAAEQFIRETPQAIAARDFQHSITAPPGADRSGVRCAFRGQAYLGGYLVEERWLRVGSARLRTGCIGVVVVDPAHRGQGIGKTLMGDAFARARARGQTLLLLHGLADFYRPFGFADVFDPTDHAVRGADIRQCSPSPYRVRPAMSGDAPSLLNLYDRHYGPRPGSFARTLEQETFLVRFSAALDPAAYLQRDGAPFTPPIVAVDAADRVRGYLFVPWGPLRAFGGEVAADDWPATLALLQHHARLLVKAAAPADQVGWPLPPDSLVAALMADHFVVERTATSRPWANWEACVVDPLSLMRGMAPVWNERWRCHRSSWNGAFDLAIDGVTQTVHLTPDEVTIADAGSPKEHTARLTGAVVAPLLFGFRSPTWAAMQDRQHIPPELLPMLDVLFPPVTPWIAPTDGC
jgi:predicted N-acetyltransferase YhbS